MMMMMAVRLQSYSLDEGGEEKQMEKQSFFVSTLNVRSNKHWNTSI